VLRNRALQIDIYLLTKCERAAQFGDTYSFQKISCGMQLTFLTT